MLSHCAVLFRRIENFSLDHLTAGAVYLGLMSCFRLYSSGSSTIEASSTYRPNTSITSRSLSALAMMQQSYTLLEQNLHFRTEGPVIDVSATHQVTKGGKSVSVSERNLFSILSSSYQQPEQHSYRKDSKQPDSKHYSMTLENKFLEKNHHTHFDSFTIAHQTTNQHIGDDYQVDASVNRTNRYVIALHECSHGRTIPIRGSSGVIYLANSESVLKTGKSNVFCRWEVKVAQDYFVAARFKTVSVNCTGVSLNVRENSPKKVIGIYSCNQDAMIYSSKNTVVFEGYILTDTNATMFYLYFTTVNRSGRRVLPAVMTSSTTGQVTSAGFGLKAFCSFHVNARYDLIVPINHVIMISFPRVDFSSNSHGGLVLYEISNNKRFVVGQVCGTADYQPKLFNMSLSLVMVTANTEGGWGFKMQFSFHPTSQKPEVYDSGLLNCSGSTYHAFKQHVHCNLARDCVGGEDEGGHCPFSSQPCNGSVAVKSKCYMFFRSENPVTWYEAATACESRGWILATVKTAEEREAVAKIFHYSRWWSAAYVGLRKLDRSSPSMYRKLWVWIGNVVAYSADIVYDPHIVYDPSAKTNRLCAYTKPHSPTDLHITKCRDTRYARYFCELTIEEDPNNPRRSSNSATPPDLSQKVSAIWSAYAVTECPYGHVTFSFLSCDPASECGTWRHQTSCTTPHTTESDRFDQRERKTRITNSSESKLSSKGPSTPDNNTIREHTKAGDLSHVTVFLFVCDDGKTIVSYSLVCDYVPNCPGGRDETFCHHDDCQELACNSGQCFLVVQKCNIVYDCLDRSDEDNCPPKNKFQQENPWINFLPPPTIIDFSERGNFTQRSLQESGSCPETHFHCAGIKSHCLPVYVRCNGVHDCLGLEDEEGCYHYACPGFYRCRQSKICIHVEHMCDGWPQCPQSDDELYCGLTCPSVCQCQGLAVQCFVKFPVQEYPQTRYLDASHSKMKPSDLVRNMYLVWLSMASCDITNISKLSLPNVIYLDLSRNAIGNVSMVSFLNIPNLSTLVLAGNPLVSLLGSQECPTHQALRNLDLSNTMLRELNCTVLSCYPYITDLNVSKCPLEEITKAGFKPISYLTSVDLSGSPVSNFPHDIFKKLDRLHVIFAANYKLCCKETLPENFNEKFCFADQNEISSCDDLLKSNLLRACVWVFTAFSVAGNLGCFLINISVISKHFRSGFNVFVINLAVSDFFMGVYLVIVGIADQMYRGQYLWNDRIWKTSPACALAGFLSLLSSENSAFIICLITLDRFIVSKFPFSDVRFNGWTAAGACGLVWTVGVSLASVPFLPMTPRWEFYGQTGICIPLPITKAPFPGHSYVFGVMIILNFVFFVLIAFGQASIYWSVRANSMVTNTTKQSQELVIARRLFTVAASDFLCWFPICLLGLLSSNGVHVSSHVNTAMGIFVLPLNSALNPFLYTLNITIERRKKAREVQLIKMLEARILAQKHITPR